MHGSTRPQGKDAVKIHECIQAFPRTLQLEYDCKFEATHPANNLQTFQHGVPRPKFEPAILEVEGEYSSRYTTEPPLCGSSLTKSHTKPSDSSVYPNFFI